MRNEKADLELKLALSDAGLMRDWKDRKSVEDLRAELQRQDTESAKLRAELNAAHYDKSELEARLQELDAYCRVSREAKISDERRNSEAFAQLQAPNL